MAKSLSPIPIVPLDVGSPEEALELVEYLDDRCRFYKVGNELFTTAGPGIVRELRARNCDVFLDLKFHDIPNTVAGGVRSAARLGARLVTVHASGGRQMLEAAVAEARLASSAEFECQILAVTVLTSMKALEIAAAWGRQADSVDLSTEVLRLASLAASAGAHGIVCSGREAPLIRERFGNRLATLVPGVRFSGGDVHDQSRVVTPSEAVAAGAKYVVIGRMVTAAPDRRAAMDRVLRELGC